jgi:glycosyltransferase involved in cell wall biosynthesis
VKVAIVHDFLIQMGGAERVVSALHELFPKAPVFTSVFRKNELTADFLSMDVKTSFLQYFPFISGNFRAYFLLYPLAFHSFDLSGFDLIISSSSGYAKGIRKRKGQVHVCYCHTPMRFAWNYKDYIARFGMNPLASKMLSLSVPALKHWDLGTVKNVDHFIANSRFVADRIRSIYQRESVIINPPVETDKFKPLAKSGDYFLVVSRLMPYKRLDLAVKAFNRLKLPLKIVGNGPALAQLKQIAAGNIEFVGRVPDEEVNELYSGCRALIFPGEEDFGITPLEAAAAGRPTIAYASGGALETVIDNKTGILFKEQSVGSLSDAVERFMGARFDRQKLVEHAHSFRRGVFIEKMKGFLNENKIF